MKLFHNFLQVTGRQRTVWLTLVLLTVSALVVHTIFSRGGDQGRSPSEQPVFTVEKGPLTISVTEAGTIRPREQVILKSEVEGQTVILKGHLPETSPVSPRCRIQPVCF